MIEEWKDIQGYEGRYLVSSLGRIYSKIHKKFHSQVLVTMVICELCFLTDREVVQNE